MNNLDKNDVSSRFLVTELTDLDGSSSKEIQDDILLDNKVEHEINMNPESVPLPV